MIIVLNNSINSSQKGKVINYLEAKGFKIKEIVGEKETVLGAVGSGSINPAEIEILDGVAKVVPISRPYKLASRELKKEDTVFDIGPVTIGGGRLCVIAGPCAVESAEQILESAIAVRKAGGVMLRGGAFKPRTSPYAFQGLGEEGCRYLKEAGEKTGLAVVTEVVSPVDVEMMCDYIDVFQIGARNMQNFELLKKVGATGMPIILKRGLSATIEEWLMAAEYILSSGSDKIILCERGIRTFETATRNTLDLSAIPVVKKLSHLPVFVDPSHATGLRDKVLPMALAGVAAGADGLIIEVHPHPEEALSDGPQSLYPEQFEKLMCDIEALVPVVGKELSRIPDRRTLEVTGSRMGKSTNKSSGDNKMRIGFQGVHGAYSELASQQWFKGDSFETVPSLSFEDVFKQVFVGEVDRGVIPLENSIAGSILENFDLFSRYPDIHIVGDIKVRVRHNLMAKKGSAIKDIKKVYSHPQALAQCVEYLKAHNMKAVTWYDTAGGASYVAEESDRSIAAIAGIEAAETYGLEILAEGIETNPHNFTRFAIIAHNKRVPVSSECDKASLTFALHHETGSLTKCLMLFSEFGLNMAKIESRPIHGKPWSYQFYVDLELPSGRGPLDKALEKMGEVAESYRLLGVYPSR